MRVENPSGDALAVSVAMFPHVKSKEFESVCLVGVLEKIKAGRWRGKVEALRKLLADGNEEAYRREKEQKLATFFVSGNASSAKEMISHSGLIQVDLDEVGIRFGDLRELLTHDPHAAAVFTSPSGRGVKVLMRVAPVNGKAEHGQAFASVSAYIVERYGIKPDPSCRNWNRHCFVSFDPDLFRNLNAIRFEWRDADITVGTGGEERENSSSNTPILQDCTPAKLPDYATASLPNYPTTPQGLSASLRTKLDALGFRQKLEKENPGLRKQYQSLVEKRHEARGEHRNETIIQAVPFLYRALSNETLLKYMEWFYQGNAHVFKDSLETHMGQVRAMVASVGVTYAAELNQTERAYWDALEEAGRGTFRICRDLAFFIGATAPAPPLFYLSGNELAKRCGKFRKSGEPQDEYGTRQLEQLLDFDIITVDFPGSARSLGQVGVATRYRWML